MFAVLAFPEAVGLLPGLRQRSSPEGAHDDPGDRYLPSGGLRNKAGATVVDTTGVAIGKLELR